MKLLTKTMFLMIFILLVGCKPRQPIGQEFPEQTQQTQQITITEDKPPPETADSETEEPGISLTEQSEIIMEQELTPSTPVEHKEEEQEITPETSEINERDLVLEIISRQNSIPVPHDLPDGSTKVVRLEPDGIHVRSSSGIYKINYEAMDEDLQNKYFINEDAAKMYRNLIYQSRKQAQAEAAQQTAVRLATEEQQRRKEEAVREQKNKEEEKRQREIARQLWADYDHRYKHYLRVRSEREYSKRIGRTVTMPMAPKKPDVPRP